MKNNMGIHLKQNEELKRRKVKVKLREISKAYKPDRAFSNSTVKILDYISNSK